MEEASRLIREALKESAVRPLAPPSPLDPNHSFPLQTDPLTGLLDLDLLNTTTSLQGRKLAGDLTTAVLTALESLPRASKYSALTAKLQENASVRIDTASLNEVITALKNSGEIKVVGQAGNRTITLMGGVRD